MRNSKFRQIKIIFVLLILLISICTILSACTDEGDKNKHQENYYIITYLAEEGGKVEGIAVQSVKEGENAEEVTAIPDEGYQFVKWSDGVTTATRRDTNVISAITVTAEFEKQYLLVQYSVLGGGTISGNASQRVAYGENAKEVTAIPDEGYQFVKWSDGVATATRRDTNIISALTVTAEFEKQYLFVQYSAVGGGTISGNASQRVAYGENAEEVTAVPDEGYYFVKWSDGVATATRRDTNVISAIAVTAEFEKQYLLVQYSVVGGGTINGNANQRVAYGENAEEVTAVPDEGYYFVKWSDGVATATRRDTNIISALTVTAEFEKQYLFVQYSAVGGGTISGNASQRVAYGENAEEVTAVPDEGYYFVNWSDGSTNPTRQAKTVTMDIRLTARFERYRYTVQFLADQRGTYGYIYYLENNGDNIYYGESSSKVYAVPRSGCVFLYWSDGSTEVERQISFVTEDITLTAYFGYSVDYIVNDNVGGKIMGNTNQAVLPGADFEEVTAVADEGFVFAGWSDLKIQSNRQDLSAERCWEYIAYFEPTEKTFRYDYTEAMGMPLVNEVTINRDELSNVEFVIPDLPGFTFCGWYADKDYSLMVVNESGIYMLGVYGLTLETNVLYAKWKAEDADEGIVHKVLVVIVQDIEATLYSKKADKYIDVDYSMTSLEREFGLTISKKMSYYLNGWFKEKDIHFEVDSYFTLQTVHVDSNGTGNYSIYADEMPEIGALNFLYHNVIVIHSMNDYDYLLHASSGIASKKYGDVYLDSMLLSYIINHIPLPNVLNGLQNDSPEYSHGVTTALHEFTHTCELNYHYTEILGFHEVESDYIGRAYELGLTNVQALFEAVRVYLLGVAELNGQIGGVPLEYFNHEIDITVNYVDAPVNRRTAGRIVVVGETPPTEPWATDVSRKIPYGSSITVEAVPNAGYRFLKWSDGVTTAIRTDTVISHVHVKAIFVEDC